MHLSYRSYYILMSTPSFTPLTVKTKHFLIFFSINRRPCTRSNIYYVIRAVLFRTSTSGHRIAVSGRAYYLARRQDFYIFQFFFFRMLYRFSLILILYFDLTFTLFGETRIQLTRLRDFRFNENFKKFLK